MQEQKNNHNSFEDRDIDKDLYEMFPLFKKWRNLYAFVLIELVILIILFYLFSQAYV